jgi:general secretion pathway protein G
MGTKHQTDGLSGDFSSDAACGEPRTRATSRPTLRTWLAARQLPIRNSQLHRQSGFTFVELLVVSTLLIILASAIMPLAKVTIQRQREAELRRALREMRTAIDKFKDAADNGLIGAMDLKTGAEGYPADLETLVEGVSVVNDQSGRKLKFLRRIAIDPMTNSTDWGRRSYQDRPDASSWGGQNVFDVYTKSTAVALDGTKYRDW